MISTDIDREIRAALRAIRSARQHISRAYLASERGTPLEDRTANLRHDAHALQNAVARTLKMLGGVE